MSTPRFGSAGVQGRGQGFAGSSSEMGEPGTRIDAPRSVRAPASEFGEKRARCTFNIKRIKTPERVHKTTTTRESPCRLKAASGICCGPSWVWKQALAGSNPEPGP
eukprot:1888324-Rhodomonas_salina.1